MIPFLQAEANFVPSGDHATHNIQFLWASQLYNGVSHDKSHNRTDVSPEPLASCLPSGLKATEQMASVWPSMLLVHRVTARTLTIAYMHINIIKVHKNIALVHIINNRFSYLLVILLTLQSCKANIQFPINLSNNILE